MAIDKSLAAGSTAMLLLGLLSERDMYGYEMIDTLARRSDNTFSLKAGTLYPLLRTLEQKGWVTCYEESAGNARVRKYYHLTEQGKGQLRDKRAEWEEFTSAVSRVMNGGAGIATFG